MGCCGGRRAQAPGAPSAESVAALAANVNGNGNVLVRYTGLSMGGRVYRTTTGHAYTFGVYENVAAMPPADAAYFEQLPDFQVVR